MKTQKLVLFGLVFIFTLGLTSMSFADSIIKDYSFKLGDASSNALGFQGGMGIEFNLTEAVGLFFEMTGRYANLKNWEGQNQYRDFLGASESESVDWYYAEEYDDTTRQWYRTLQIMEEEPSGDYYRNVRKAEISYSGVVFRLGVRIAFGKK